MFQEQMDKLRKALSGDDSTPDEESNIITQVHMLNYFYFCCGFKFAAIFANKKCSQINNSDMFAAHCMIIA